MENSLSCGLKLEVEYMADVFFVHKSGNISCYIQGTEYDYGRLITYTPNNVVLTMCFSKQAVEELAKLARKDSNAFYKTERKQLLLLDFGPSLMQSFDKRTAIRISEYYNLLLSDYVLCNDHAIPAPYKSDVVGGIALPGRLGKACADRYRYANRFNFNLQANNQFSVLEFAMQHKYIAKRGRDESDDFWNNGGYGFQAPAAFISNVIMAYIGKLREAVALENMTQLAECA